MKSEMTCFRLDPKILKKLRSIKKKTGLSISTQVTFALKKWIEIGLWKEM
jgi:antitoxin component of RelBE/YafQ-DinJ toxin-antitoxin module